LGDSGDKRRLADAETAPGASPTRVALLILELSVGGAEKALFQLATTLDRERFTPIVYSLSGRARDRKNSLAPELRAHGVEVVELGLRCALGAPLAMIKLSRALRRDRVDVLQCFMFHANILGRFAGRIAGVPVVCSGVRVAERDAPCRIWLDRFTRRLVDAWVCVGESVAEFTRKSGIPEERVTSIPNGVAALSLDQASLPERSGGRKRMISVGRLARQKGFDWLFESSDVWLSNEIRENWTLWLVGEGEERESLERLCDKKGLGDFVRFTGWRSDAKELMAGSELFLLPSRWEGMPNALLEACALGLPALCARVEGVEEILGPNSELQSCEPGDLEEWRDKLTRLTSDAELRCELGKRNRLRVISEFNVESTTCRYETLWARLLKKKRSDCQLC
jgi:glycosyltransferase involved in cell wall biosynthesis